MCVPNVFTTGCGADVLVQHENTAKEETSRLSITGRAVIGRPLRLRTPTLISILHTSGASCITEHEQERDAAELSHARPERELTRCEPFTTIRPNLHFSSSPACSRQETKRRGRIGGRNGGNTKDRCYHSQVFRVRRCHGEEPTS